MLFDIFAIFLLICLCISEFSCQVTTITTTTTGAIPTTTPASSIDNGLAKAHGKLFDFFNHNLNLSSIDFIES
jgi:hypothetical protein